MLFVTLFATAFSRKTLVLAVQRCSTQSFDRSRDIHHPDFPQGRPAYFDVSIRNSFNPFQIINAANEAGAAAKFGESEKDNRHDDNVTAADGFFYPLVVQTYVYAVWSTHSLEVIKFIVKIVFA